MASAMETLDRGTRTPALSEIAQVHIHNFRTLLYSLTNDLANTIYAALVAC